MQPFGSNCNSLKGLSQYRAEREISETLRLGFDAARAHGCCGARLNREFLGCTPQFWKTRQAARLPGRRADTEA